MDYFRLLWPVEVDQFLADATNSRNVKVRQISQISREDITKYLKVLMFNGVLGLKSWEMLFSNNGWFGYLC